MIIIFLIYGWWFLFQWIYLWCDILLHGILKFVKSDEYVQSFSLLTLPQQKEVDMIISEMEGWMDEPQTLPYIVLDPNTRIFTSNTSREKFIITINFEPHDANSFVLLSCTAVWIKLLKPNLDTWSFNLWYIHFLLLESLFQQFRGTMSISRNW